MKLPVPACSFHSTRAQSVDVREKTCRSLITCNIQRLLAEINKSQHLSFVWYKLIEQTIVIDSDVAFVLFDHNWGVRNDCLRTGCCFFERGVAVEVLECLMGYSLQLKGHLALSKRGGAGVAVLFYFQVKLPLYNVTTQHIFFCLMVYGKHSFASDILIKRATLPRAAGTAARGPEFKDIPSRHRTHHKTWRTKERQQRERDYSGDLSASRPLFILSHLARRCQTTVISSKRCWLTESIHSNLHPTNFQMLRFQFGYNGVTLKRERISLAVWRATAGRENIG